jgi:sugar/nucleoside kinase (ribokinase family)
MAVPSRQSSVDTDSGVRDEDSAPARTVSIHSTNPERSVFIEEGNTDGWISTDVTVDLER